MGSLHQLPKSEKLSANVTLERHVFFYKEDIKVGAILRNIGRRTYGSMWRVEAVAPPKGYVRTRGTDPRKVHMTADRVTVRDVFSGEERTLTFACLCYSAIWWLESWKGERV